MNGGNRKLCQKKGKVAVKVSGTPQWGSYRRYVPDCNRDNQQRTFLPCDSQYSDAGGGWDSAGGGQAGKYP